jgi:hypothetical protein
MLHVYLDESGIHASSQATAVIAAVAAPAAWEEFDAEWISFLQDIGINASRKGYGSLTDNQWTAARDKLCQLLINTQFFIAGSAIGRQTYNKARAGGKWRLPVDPYKFCLERCLQQGN